MDCLFNYFREIIVEIHHFCHSIRWIEYRLMHRIRKHDRVKSSEFTNTHCLKIDKKRKGENE